MGSINTLSTDTQSISATTQLDSNNMEDAESYTVQINTTAASSLDVDFTIEVSNDDTNWATLDGSSQNFTTNTTHVLEVTTVSYKFMRVVYTRTAGSATFGTITVIKNSRRR